MPELPDLEVFTQNLNNYLNGTTLTDLIIQKDKRVSPSTTAIEKLIGNRVHNIFREGKEVCFDFGDNRIHFHLMLNGFFSIGEMDLTPNYEMSRFCFGNKNLVLSDRQGYATIALNKEINSAPDALSNDFSIEYLKEKLAKYSRKNIKAFLIDQNIIKGIGNAYADEILWASLISPKSKTGKIPTEKISALHENIKEVLLQAIKKVAEHSPNATGGEYRDFLSVHNKNKETSPTGHKIIIEKVSSKKTYYTEEQELFI